MELHMLLLMEFLQNYKIALVFDARGNGGGETCPTITGNHQDRITDYTAIVVVTPPPALDNMLKE